MDSGDFMCNPRIDRIECEGRTDTYMWIRQTYLRMDQFKFQYNVANKPHYEIDCCKSDAETTKTDSVEMFARVQLQLEI